MLICRMHVFEDIMPYICTFPGCRDELHQFPSRNTWAEHEIEEHRSCIAWACPECPVECSDPTAWSVHVQETHDRAFNPLQNKSAADAAYRKRPRPINDDSCCLCAEKLGKTHRDIKTHLGRHMEEIALMALPRGHEDDSDDSSHSIDEAASFHGLPSISVRTSLCLSDSQDTARRLSAQLDEEYAIKCFCGFLVDDGNTVYCDRCETWQHIECYYFQDFQNGQPPNIEQIEHRCIDCEPRPHDKKGAIERQEDRLNPNGLLCSFTNCRRSRIGHAFEQTWKLDDHLKKVHGLGAPIPDSSSDGVLIGESSDVDWRQSTLECYLSATGHPSRTISQIKEKPSNSAIATRFAEEPLDAASQSKAGASRAAWDPDPGANEDETPERDLHDGLEAGMQPPQKEFVTHCPSCNAEFVGRPQNCTSNLRRHLRTVHNRTWLTSIGYARSRKPDTDLRKNLAD